VEPEVCSFFEKGVVYSYFKTGNGEDGKTITSNYSEMMNYIIVSCI